MHEMTECNISNKIGKRLQNFDMIQSLYHHDLTLHSLNNKIDLQQRILLRNVIYSTLYKLGEIFRRTEGEFVDV